MLSFFSIPYAVQKATLHLKQWLFSGIHCCFVIILCGEVVEGHAMSSFLEACLYSTSGVYALHVVGKYIVYPEPFAASYNRHNSDNNRENTAVKRCIVNLKSDF